MPQYNVLDTNIILLDTNNIHKLGADGSIIVIPETTINELDSFKSGFSELAFQSRSFGRMIASAKRLPKDTINDLRITKLVADSTEIWIVSSSQYPDFSQVDPKTLNDRRIIEIAYQLHHANVGEVTFYSNDIMCGITADSLGITSKELREVENTDFEFTRTMELSAEDFSTVHNKDIFSINPGHTPNLYNYKFTTENSSQVKLATIHNNMVSVIGKDSEDALRKQDISPCNAEQLFLSRAIQDPTIDIVVCEALSGSGKTVSAISNAIRLVNTNSPYESIHYIRASVSDLEKSEEIGFLKGNDEKYEVFTHPLYDTLDFIVRGKLKGGKAKNTDIEEKVAEGVEKLIRTCNITAMITQGMRGRTFHNTICILDETQNMSKPSLRKVLTRFGKNCKIIIIGSQRQLDCPYLTKNTNGLSVLLDACTKPQELINMHAVTLHKVARGSVAEFAELLFDQNKGN